MTIKYSIKNSKDSNEFWRGFLAPGSRNPLIFYHQDDGDVILQIPKQLGWGYRQYIPLRDGLILAINNCGFDDDFVVEWLSFEPFEPFVSTQPELVLDFLIEGHSPEPDAVSGSNCCTIAMPTPLGAGTFFKRTRGEKIFEIELTLRPPFLKAFLANLLEPVSLEFKQMLEALSKQSFSDRVYSSPLTIHPSPAIWWSKPSTPEMQQVISQILNCPYQGFNRRFYLEARTLDLMNLWLEQTLQLFTRIRQGTEPLNVRSCEVVEQVYQARDILLSRFANPPSLSDLSRQVGLNRRKLNEEFQQVFQKTPFAYLLDYRLERAQQLLEKPDVKIKDVAQMIGYTNQGKFATAFRKKFGLNPKTYQQQYLERMV